MECVVEQDRGYIFTARRNNSLTPRGRLLAFGGIAAVSLAIAFAFALFGAWMILPFAGAEVLLLLAAFRYIAQHAFDYERLIIDGDVVEIEVSEMRKLRRYRFNRWWAQIKCARDGTRLALRSHGREIEFGRHLTAEQRLAVALKLEQHLRSRKTRRCY